jgi:hypothetical protein
MSEDSFYNHCIFKLYITIIITCAVRYGVNDNKYAEDYGRKLKKYIEDLDNENNKSPTGIGGLGEKDQDFS